MIQDKSAAAAAAEFRKASSLRRASEVFRKGVRWGFEGNLIAVPIVALSGAMAQPGEKVPAMASISAGAVAFPVLMGGTAAALSLIPGVGSGTAMFLAFLGSMYPTAMVENGVNRAVRKFSRFGTELRRLEMGAGIQDTEGLSGLRMQAIQDMSAARLVSRRYLGQEARLLHR